MLFDAHSFERTDPGTGVLNPEGSQYVVEASQLCFIPPRNFVLKNCPQDGMHRSFHLKNVDRSGEDIAGWRYVEDAGPNKGRDFRNPGSPREVPPFTVLIIND